MNPETSNMPDQHAASRSGEHYDRLTVTIPQRDLPSFWLNPLAVVEYDGRQWIVDSYRTEWGFALGTTFIFELVSIVTTEEPKGNSMSDPVVNKSLAVLLLDVPGLRAVTCSYEGLDPKTLQPQDTPVLFKTFERDLKVGEIVVVPTKTRVGFTCVQVAALDVEVDYESTKEVGWIVGKFDASGYAGIVAKENQIIEAVKAADKKARQNEIKKRLLGNVDPNSLPVIDLQALTGPAAGSPKPEGDA